MKKFLRKWLEVPDATGLASKSNVKDMVEGAIYEAMAPGLSAQRETLYWGRPEHRNLRGMLEGYTRSLLRDEAEKKVKQHIDELVDAEKFIDGVVSRIKRKQLGV